MAARVIETKFWTTTQNNSGGSFDHDPEKGIGYAISVEALDEEDAKARTKRIVDSYVDGGDCPCCGARWSIYFFDDDAEEEPMLFGKPLTGSWGIPSYVHYIDGRIEVREVKQVPA